MPPPTSKLKNPHRLKRPDARALNMVGDKWAPLILAELADGPVRFVELQRRLFISTEQLRSRLKRMVADGLITRQRYREMPPRVEYELTVRGTASLVVVAALARFGDTLPHDPEERAVDQTSLLAAIKIAEQG